NRPKLIHAYDLDTVLPALLAKPFIRCKVVYDIADWYAQSRRVGRLKRLVEKIDRWVCQKVDYVIIAHEERIKQLGFQPKRLEVLYNSPPDVLKEVKSKQNKCKDYFVYVGVLQPDRGIDKIVEASKLAGTRVLIAGFGPLADYCGKVSSEYSNIEFLGQIPYEKTLELEANAIAILALYNPEIENNKYAAPNKLYEAMMLGKSIITTKDTLVGRFVEKESIGIVIDYNSVDELAMAMNKLQKDSTLSKTMGERSRMLYDKIYSSKKQCDKLCRIYGELLALRNASSQEEIIC
ncbi:MAG: glycosyltransferase, partial [Fervidobacterium sp.]